jgi:phosphatidylglycerol:prolipoprotein diacylglycerol transferase
MRDAAATGDPCYPNAPAEPDPLMFTCLAESYLHTIDPFAIRFTEGFGLRWYGLAYLAGFLVAWLVIRWFAATDRSPLTKRDAGDLMFYAIAGVLLGGRLGYALFYDPALFIGFSSQIPFWDLLAINKGGMASHGGMIGVIVACWIFARSRGVPALHLFDLGALTCTAGFFFGRIANFVNAELWGRPLPPEMQDDPPWWSVKYPEEIFLWNPERPADAERLIQLDQLRSVIGGEATFYESIVQAARSGNERVIEVLQPLLTAYWPSQIFQALADGLIVAAVLALIWLRPRKPGVVGSWYLIVYGGLRIATEFFRQPDEGVAMLLGLSRGQVLSVAMMVVGAVVLAVCARRDAPKMGGLIRTAGS